jgi:hypothetical protein
MVPVFQVKTSSGKRCDHDSLGGDRQAVAHVVATVTRGGRPRRGDAAPPRASPGAVAGDVCVCGRCRGRGPAAVRRPVASTRGRDGRVGLALVGAGEPGRPFRAPGAHEESSICSDCRRHPRVGHRREHCRLQRCQRRGAATPPLRRTGSSGPDLRNQPTQSRGRPAPERRRIQTPESIVRGHRRLLCHRSLSPLWRDTRTCDDRQGGAAIFFDPGRAAAARPNIRPGRSSDRRGRFRELLEHSPGGRSVGRRKLPHPRRSAIHHHWRHARVFSVSVSRGLTVDRGRRGRTHRSVDSAGRATTPAQSDRRRHWTAPAERSRGLRRERAFRHCQTARVAVPRDQPGARRNGSSRCREPSSPRRFGGPCSCCLARSDFSWRWHARTSRTCCWCV